jgi:hypothetical protein
MLIKIQIEEGVEVARDMLGRVVSYQDLVSEHARLQKELAEVVADLERVSCDSQRRIDLEAEDTARLTYLGGYSQGKTRTVRSLSKDPWYENYWLRQEVRRLLLALEDKKEWEDRLPAGVTPTTDEKLLAFRELAAKRLLQLHAVRKEFDQLTKVMGVKNRLLEALGYPWNMQSGPWSRANPRYPEEASQRPPLTQQVLEDMVHMLRYHVRNWNYDEGVVTTIDWNDPKFLRRI